MFKLMIISALCISALALPAQYEIVEDAERQSYYLVPIREEHSRIRRDSQTTAGATDNGQFIKHEQTIIDNDKHKFDASAWAMRYLHKNTPLTTGNQVNYEYKPSNSGFSVLTENTRGQGTDAQARATYNFFKTQDKQGTVGISGTYNRHFGGPYGTGPAGGGVLLHGRYNF